MKLRWQPHQPLAVTSTSGAFFAVAFLVASTALAGRMVTAWRTYEPRPGLVCPNDGWVDFSQLVGASPGWKPYDSEEQDFFEASRRDLANKPWQGAPGVWVRTRGTLEPSDATVSASKSSSGEWRLTFDREADRLGGAKAHAEVALSRTQGDELERMLADPCLYAEPELVGPVYPTAGHGPGRCWDGLNTYLNVRFAGRRRTAVQACDTYGLTGKLVHFLNQPFSAANA